MSISSALQWWEEWQLRILVLASLFVYYILNFSFTVRRLPNLRRLRVVIWIAYIGSDALAIYALATLFNRHKQTTMMLEGSVATATTLEVVWAPVLLIHLGGHQTISAYSLEDNELWKRHVITFVSQVTVALYVFCKWWSGEKKLLQAAVLLFIVGIIKFGHKPWALKMASFNRMHMLDSTLVSLQSEKISCNTNLVDIVVDMLGRGGGEKDLSLKDYVRDARNCVVKGMHADTAQKTSDGSCFTNMVVGLEDIFSEGTNMMFVDMSAPYRVRLMVLQSFMELEDAHDKLQQCLAHTFERLYSRISSMNNHLGTCLRIVLTSLSIASVVLLAKSNKDGYDKNDVRVTYILYCGNLTMEFLPYFLIFLYMPFKQCRQLYSRRWH